MGSTPPDGKSGSEGDPLAEIDELMQRRAENEQRLSEDLRRREAEREAFARDFTTVFETRLRPVIEEVIERLRRDGGGGMIVERPEDLRLGHRHRYTVWMSFNGEIPEVPREDRFPYLRLDADVERQMVIVSEGDMWQGDGGHSGRFSDWTLSEVTEDATLRELLAVLERAAG